MTVEWKDICERCLTVHDAMPDGSPATCELCQARVELLQHLRRTLFARSFVESHQRAMEKAAADLLIEGRQALDPERTAVEILADIARTYRSLTTQAAGGRSPPSSSRPRR